MEREPKVNTTPEEREEEEKKPAPFFARFLKGQGIKIKSAVKAGGTLKYPSDRDEDIG